MKTEPLQVADVVIEEVDLASMTDEQILALNTFGNLLRAESNPEDPPRPVELTAASIRNIPPFVAVREFVGLDPEGAIAATGEAVVMRTDDNKHLAQAGVSVRPDRRRLGIAKAMLGLIADATEAEGRTLIMGGTSERVPAGGAFAQAIGAELGLAQHINRLLLSELETALIDRWIKEAPDRAPGYSLVAIDGPYPDELLQEILGVHRIMNTAPRGSLDMEDFSVNDEHERQWEKSMQASGDQRWSLFARHEATGELVGFTEVLWNPKLPTILHQLGTGVHPDHRGHALGKWLKAAMLRRVLDERAEATEVRTGNADSNDAMLGINNQLGFKPHVASPVWQVTLEKVRAYLGSST